MFPFSLLSFTGIALAADSVSDPSHVISPLLWATDNAISPNCYVPFISIQPEAVPVAYTFEKNSTKIDHESFSTTLDNTSVILVVNGAELDLSFVDIQKSSYASNLLWSSFYAFSAAMNIMGGAKPYSSAISQSPNDTKVVPTFSMDTIQKVYLTNCKTTTGFLGGVAILSSATRTSGAILSLNSSKITVLPHSAPGLWFGNTIIDVSLYGTDGILVVANFFD